MPRSGHWSGLPLLPAVCCMQYAPCRPAAATRYCCCCLTMCNWNCLSCSAGEMKSGVVDGCGQVWGETRPHNHTSNFLFGKIIKALRCCAYGLVHTNVLCTLHVARGPMLRIWNLKLKHCLQLSAQLSALVTAPTSRYTARFSQSRERPMPVSVSIRVR